MADSRAKKKQKLDQSQDVKEETVSSNAQNTSSPSSSDLCSASSVQGKDPKYDNALSWWLWNGGSLHSY